MKNKYYIIQVVDTYNSESLPTYEMNESENFHKTINTDFGYFDKGKLTLFDKPD